MDDNNNSTFQGHPFYLPLAMFNFAARTPFAIAAAFWRPWFTEPGKRKVPTRKQSEVPTEDVLQPQPEKKGALLRQNQSVKSLATQSGRHQRLCRKKWR